MIESSADLTAIASATRDGFTGHEHLDNIGLIHMNGRAYDPGIGRFLSADPFVQDPASSQSFNRYSYTANNPTTFVDPSGFAFCLSFSFGGGGYDDNSGFTVDFGFCDGQDYLVPGGGGVTGPQGLFAEPASRSIAPSTLSTVGGSWSPWNLFGISTAEAQTRPPGGGGRQGGRGGRNGQRIVPGGGTNVERYVPGGSLQANEQFPRAHVLREHVGRSVSQLQARLAANPRLSAASSFRTEAEAEAFIAEALAQAPIQRMNVGSGHWYQHAFRIELGHRTGVSVIPGAPSPAIPTGVRIVLRHDPASETGYYIYTAYPD